MYRYLLPLLIFFGHYSAMAQDKTIKEKIEGNLTYQYKYDSIWNEYYLFTFEINSKYFKNNIVISEECSLKEGVGKNLKQKIVSILKKNASNFNTNMSYSPFVVIVFPTSDGQIQECFIKWRSNEPLLKSEVIEQIMEEIKTIKLSYENIPKGKVYYCPNIGFGITKKDWVYITSRSNQ